MTSGVRPISEPRSPTWKALKRLETHWAPSGIPAPRREVYYYQHYAAEHGIADYIERLDRLVAVVANDESCRLEWA